MQVAGGRDGTGPEDELNIAVFEPQQSRNPNQVSTAVQYDVPVAPVGMKISKLIDALLPRSGLSQARSRAREVQKQMHELLKSDLETFKRGLRELGLLARARA